MKFKSKYTSKQPNENGLIHYTAEEDNTWKALYARQIQTIQGRVAKAYLKGVELLNMPSDCVPQLKDINEALKPLSGWAVSVVPALISTEAFFTLLKNKQFPAATFIRVPEELDYLEEPDIFHEFFGHCPMLTHPVFAAFMQRYAEVTLAMTADEQEMMARLFWFTVEFGLINEDGNTVCYGGGILSSHGETIYAGDSKLPVRKPFDLLDVLRTPYRIDIMQPVYFVIESYEQLFDVLNDDLSAKIAEAKRLGEHAPLFETADYSEENEEWVTC